MSNETWLIEPHDSLIVRDGRPFNATAGSRAKSLDFPFPSTLIGSVRTRIGLENGGDWSGFSKELIDEILQIEMFGALLAEIKDDDSLEFFAPTPADSLYIKPEDEADKNLFPLVPLSEKYFSNLNENLDVKLRLLGIEKDKDNPNKDVKGKPNSEVKFWHWSKFEEWLIKSESQKIESEKLGIGGLISDQRTHVKIDYERKSNIDGGLFQTRGLEFTTKDDRKRLTLALQLSDSKDLNEGLFPLGGERRVVRWSKKDCEFPKCPQAVVDGIKKSDHCRLILLTPAYFEKGFLPDEDKLGAKVKAVAVNRSQVISGWDFKGRFDKQKNRFIPCPKPTRRLTPAGTVYFLEINGDVEKFIEQTWFKNIGDCKQTKLDGFGLAVLGNWDGNTENEI
jgi:CRISPR-associated protein Cmr3